MANTKRTALKPEQYKAVALMVYKDVNGLTNEMIAKEVGSILLPCMSGRSRGTLMRSLSSNQRRYRGLS